jgi:hypothetical protein
MIGQGVLLRNNTARRRFGIPLIPKEAQPKLPTLVDTFREIPNYFKNRIAEAEAKQRRAQASQFRR